MSRDGRHSIRDKKEKGALGGLHDLQLAAVGEGEDNGEKNKKGTKINIF